jgi:hypothetical protein
LLEVTQPQPPGANHAGAGQRRLVADEREEVVQVLSREALGERRIGGDD